MIRSKWRSNAIFFIIVLFYLITPCMDSFVLFSFEGIDFFMFVTEDHKPKYEAPNLFFKHISPNEISRRVAKVLRASGLANILGLSICFYSLFFFAIPVYLLNCLFFWSTSEYCQFCLLFRFVITFSTCSSLSLSDTKF